MDGQNALGLWLDLIPYSPTRPLHGTGPGGHRGTDSRKTMSGQSEEGAVSGPAPRAAGQRGLCLLLWGPVQWHLQWLSGVPSFSTPQEQHGPAAARRGSRVMVGSSCPAPHTAAAASAPAPPSCSLSGQRRWHRCLEGPGLLRGAHPQPTALAYTCDAEEGAGPACSAAHGHPAHGHRVRGDGL